MKLLRLSLYILMAVIASRLDASWSLQHSTDFSGISNTSAVGAGATLTDGWIDATGSVFSVNSGKLVGSVWDSNGYSSRYLLRPVAEAQSDARIVGRFAAGDIGSAGQRGFMLRKQSATNNYYLLKILNGTFNIFSIVGGSVTGTVGSGSWTYSASDIYTVDYSVTGTSPSTFSLTIFDVTTSTTTFTNSSYTDSTAGLQSAGVSGVTLWDTNPATSYWVKLDTYQQATGLASGTVSTSSPTSTSLTVAYTGASGGTSPYTYALYRSTTTGFTPSVGNRISASATFPYSDTGLSSSTTYYYKVIVTDNVAATSTSNEGSGTTSAPASLASGTLSTSSTTTTTAVLAYTGATGGTPAYTYALYRSTTTGFTPAVGNRISASASFPYTDTGLTPTTTYYYKAIVTDSLSATSTSNQATATTLTPSALVAGTLSFTSATDVNIVIAYSSASGGVTPYTYALYRSTVADFTPGVGNIISASASFPYTDTPPSNSFYYYKAVVTDNVAATATSNQIMCNLWLPKIIIGFVGDSITVGYNGTDPCPIVAAHLAKLRKQRQITVVNQGVSGTTTFDWQSGSANLSTAKTAFASAGVQYVMVMLGTNDARIGPISQSSYQTYLTSICTDLTGAGYKVILNYPPYMVDSTANGRIIYLTQYQSVMDGLVNGTTILAGDKIAYQYFAQHSSELGDGLHPNSTGDESLGTMWAAAIDRALNPSSGAATSRAFSF